MTEVWEVCETVIQMEWEKKIRGEKMNQKLWVIVPAQCTQLSIVQVLRASAITAQLMPVAWLQLQLRITTRGPVQKGGGKKGRRAGNWILAVSERRTRVRVEGCEKVWKPLNVSRDLLLVYLNQSSLSIYIYDWPHFLLFKAATLKECAALYMGADDFSVFILSKFCPLWTDSNFKRMRIFIHYRSPSILTSFS